MPAPLDPHFVPAVLADRAFRAAAVQSGAAENLEFAIEQADGSISRFATKVLPDTPADAAANFRHAERILKFLLWARGGFRVHLAGPRSIAETLSNYYTQTPAGKFDALVMGERVYERPFSIIHVSPAKLPPARANTAPLGRHLDGCRIGFDLGGSDRKVSAVVDGKCVFSEEVVWSPITQSDPQWHFDQIMESLQSAAKHMPRVDAIGGSAAGVYVNNRVKIASLFRGVPTDLFNTRVKDIFLELKRAWNGIPFEVVNDGEVTALAGSMSLGVNSVLGVAMGTSQAGGYVTPEGNITSWLNELAFAPVDYQAEAPADEWSGDRGIGALYFSQQAVGRLTERAGIQTTEGMPLPERLKLVQKLMEQGDLRAQRIYETIGVYLGYTMAHYADFYDYNSILILGRVTSGEGGSIIISQAQSVLRHEFPELAEKISIHTPDERDKRHGQAIAAASLPMIISP
jgi:predicted NBD/HSP70 family sugar kinase